MKPPPFRYVAATSVDDAVAALSEDGSDAKVLAGGQSLVPLMNLRLARPEVLVDLNRVAELAYVRYEDGVLRLGAMTRYADVEFSDEVRSRSPLLHTAVSRIGYSSVRNRGTIGGNTAHNDPGGTMPAILTCLGGSVVLQGPRGSREVHADDFFTGLYETAHEDDELVAEIRVPVSGAHAGGAWLTIQRRSGAFPTVAVAVHAELADGVINNPSIVLAGISDRPVTLGPVASSLQGQVPSPELLREAGEFARSEVEPGGDAFATGEYKREVIGVLVERALESVCARPTVETA